jgi:hypothetical protein
MLFEYSVDVLAPLGHAMGSEEFAIVFKNLLPIIISRTVSLYDSILKCCFNKKNLPVTETKM